MAERYSPELISRRMTLMSSPESAITSLHPPPLSSLSLSKGNESPQDARTCSASTKSPTLKNLVTDSAKVHYMFPPHVHGNISKEQGLRKLCPSPAGVKLEQDVKQIKSSPNLSHLDSNNLTAASRHSRSSVKHLTCFWWKEKGACRFSDDDCLYAHHDTGHYTDPPRQIVPGEPALAGRKLDRAMRTLATAHRSSPSLSSVAGSRHGSRPSTPGFDRNSPVPSPFQPHHAHFHHHDAENCKLTNDNQFLKTIIDQNNREKSVMITHIEDLQTENKAIKSEIQGLRTAQEQLLMEREGLQSRIQQLENQHDRFHGMDAHYGAIGTYGRPRADNEVRYLGGLLDE